MFHVPLSNEKLSWMPKDNRKNVKNFSQEHLKRDERVFSYNRASWMEMNGNGTNCKQSVRSITQMSNGKR